MYINNNNRNILTLNVNVYLLSTKYIGTPTFIIIMKIQFC